MASTRKEDDQDKDGDDGYEAENDILREAMDQSLEIKKDKDEEGGGKVFIDNAMPRPTACAEVIVQLGTYPRVLRRVPNKPTSPRTGWLLNVSKRLQHPLSCAADCRYLNQCLQFNAANLV